MVATVSMERIEYYDRLLEQWRREDRETRERSRVLFARARAQAEAYVAWARSEREMWEAWERSRLVNRLLRGAEMVCRFFVRKALNHGRRADLPQFGHDGAKTRPQDGLYGVFSGRALS